MPSIGSSRSTLQMDDGIPPPPPISTLKAIGINRYAIPKEELTSEDLQATTSITPEPKEM